MPKIVLFSALVFLGAIAPLSRASAQTVTVRESSPPEVQLAFIDTGQREIARSLVDRYAALLDELNSRCSQSRRMISDQSVRATQLIDRDRRIKVSNSKFLTEWLAGVRALPRDPSRDCVPIAAALIVTIR